jgi:ribosomal protein S27AE
MSENNISLYDTLCPRCGSTRTYLSSKDEWCYHCETCGYLFRPIDEVDLRGEGRMGFGREAYDDDSRLEENAARTDYYEQGDR